MNAEHDTRSLGAKAGATAFVDAETGLARSREILRRRLGGSVLSGCLTSQAWILSAPVRCHALNWLMTAARTKRKSNHPL